MAVQERMAILRRCHFDFLARKGCASILPSFCCLQVGDWLLPSCVCVPSHGRLLYSVFGLDVRDPRLNCELVACALCIRHRHCSLATLISVV